MSACSNGSSDATVDASAGSSDAGNTDTGNTDTGNTDSSTTDWATGGTAAMTALASYPDPFTDAGTCLALQQTTAGPCTTATTIARVDVSEGLDGLPVRLALKLIDKTTCDPIVGATIQIWHTKFNGVYSGVTPNPQMCYGSEPSAASHMFMRGSQITDADGVVYFNTCFPGWYRGRAIHVHFQVFVNGSSTEVSQLFFPEALTAAIFTSHPVYASFGQPDTSLTSDNIIGAVSDKSPYILDYARMTDGAMLASKILTA
jgi:protocatechuate 3,4-dioxygenase beta subunit